MKNIPAEVERNLKLVIREIELDLAFNNSNNLLSVKSLVEISGMSERSLRNWFKEYKGMSISGYIKKRQTDYGARILRLFPKSTKKEVADKIGLATSQSLYPFMKRCGIENIDGLKGMPILKELSLLPCRKERLSECVMFYIFDEALYNECAKPEYESSHWDKIEKFVKDSFPDSVKVGDVGFAIDRYVENKIEEGVFVSGILYRNVSPQKFSKGFRGEIGLQIIPGNKYAVFTYEGSYDGLSPFYQSVVYTIFQRDDIQVDKSLLIMEKYLNSPVDTLAEELITELWVPVIS